MSKSKSPYIAIMDRITTGNPVTIEFPTAAEVQRCRVALQRFKEGYDMFIADGEQITFTPISRGEDGSITMKISMAVPTAKPGNFKILD